MKIKCGLGQTLDSYSNNCIACPHLTRLISAISNDNSGKKRHQATPQRKYPKKRKLNLSIASDSWGLTLGRGPSSPAASTKQGNAKYQRRPSFAWIGIGHTPVCLFRNIIAFFAPLYAPPSLEINLLLLIEIVLVGHILEKRQKHNKKVAF